MTIAKEWEEAPTHPDPESDLGYQDEALTVVESSADSQFVFLPEREPQVDKQEFIVVMEGSLRDVER